MPTYPLFVDKSPADFAVEIQQDAPIFFRVTDANGLNVSSLTVKIQASTAILNGVFQAGFTGAITTENVTPTAISVVIFHTNNFSYNTHIVVQSQIDSLTVVTGNDSFSFLTIANPNHTAPLVAASPHGGIFNAAQSIILNSNTFGTTIYYTLDGTDPTLASAIYSIVVPITAEGITTLKFLGVDSANNYDRVRTEIYTLDFTAPVTIAQPTGGSYFNSQQVILSADDPKATIYYTTNNQVPTTSSSVYTSPIVLPDNVETTIKFFAVDQAGNIEAVQTEVYSIAIANNNYLVRNVDVRYNYTERQLELVWEDMNPIYTNIIGYNVYRAWQEYDKYLKINSNLLSINQYIDKTVDTEIVEEDVSTQFRKTVNISRDLNDNFKGKTFDVTKWSITDIAQLLFQYDGIIFTDKVGLTQESKVTSKFKLKGDFDIQVDFNLAKWLPPHGAISSCIFRIKREDTNYIQVAREKSQTSDVYSSTRVFNSNPDLPATVSTANSYGTLKIKRIGGVVTTYFFDINTSAFVLMQSFSSFTDDVYVEFVGRSADVPVELQWTKFKINSGRPLIIQPLNQLNEYVIQVAKIPIVDSSGANKPTDDVREVQVTIDGKRAYIKMLQGLEGQIFLETTRVYDEVRKEYFTPPVPNEYSTILVTYKTIYHTTDITLEKNYFYKVTAVTAEDETDLDLIKPETLKAEKLTYIWEEAIRRNQWLLDQGGERVLLFIKRRAGTFCSCVLRDVKQRTHKKPDKDCPECYGSGFVGGFFGPVPVLIANLTAEHRLNQTERGITLKMQVETWMGPFPVVTQRDMVVRRNGERCLIGPVTKVEANGTLTQQHFTIEFIDSTDIRYTYPIQPLANQFIPGSPGYDKPGKTVPTISSPKERENLVTSMDKVSHENKNVDRILRDRSITFENTEY